MSNIRRQSIISSLVIYVGFAVGLINVYFFTKQGLFTEAQYGLTTVFIAIATMMSSLSNMAMPSYIYKFYPYYKDHLPDRKNDMLSWALLTEMCIRDRSTAALFLPLAQVPLRDMFNSLPAH